MKEYIVPLQIAVLGAEQEQTIADLRARLAEVETLHKSVLADCVIAQARVAEATRLLKRALNQSARVHADFAQDIENWLGTADSASGVQK